MTEPLKIIPICNGELHLQNNIEKYMCYICGKLETDEMVLIRAEDKQFKFACLDHPGIVIEFLRQYKRPPLGWSIVDGKAFQSEGISNTIQEKE